MRRRCIAGKDAHEGKYCTLGESGTVYAAVSDDGTTRVPDGAACVSCESLGTTVTAVGHTQRSQLVQVREATHTATHTRRHTATQRTRVQRQQANRRDSHADDGHNAATLGAAKHTRGPPRRRRMAHIGSLTRNTGDSTALHRQRAAIHCAARSGQGTEDVTIVTEITPRSLA